MITRYQRYKFIFFFYAQLSLKFSWIFIVFLWNGLFVAHLPGTMNIDRYNLPMKITCNIKIYAHQYLRIHLQIHEE